MANGQSQQNQNSSIYQPFPIYDYDAGLNLAREPWLIPTKSFTRLFNFRIRDGVIRKRKGYEKFGEMVHAYDEEIATGDGNTASFTHTMENTPVRKEESNSYFAIYVDTDDGQVVHDEDGDGNLSGDGSGTVDYDTGEIDVTFDSDVPDGDKVKVRYNHIPSNPIIGIFNYYSGTGERQLLLFDTKRLNVYRATQEKFQDITQGDDPRNLFDGDWNKYVWLETWRGNSYFSDQEGPLFKYDGSDVEEMTIDINDDGTNDVTAIAKIFAYKDRLVLLHMTEEGEIRPQRARWSAPGTDDNWQDGGFIDAPTLDWIIGADFIGDNLVVLFERSIWALRYVGDRDVPFVWEKLISTEGTSAPLSVISFASELLFLGPVRFLSTDGMNTEEVDDAIPEFSLTFNQEHYDATFGAVLEEEQEIMWNYVAAGDTRPNSNLVMNYNNNSWYEFNIPGPVIGYSQITGDFTWNQIDQTWDELNFSWDAKELQAGYPTTLIGDQEGKVYVLNRARNDDGEDIESVVRYKPLNPYLEQGRSARLGFVDIFYTIDEDADIEVRLYESEKASPYLDQTLTLSGPTGRRKMLKRISVNAVGTTHTLEIKHIGQAVDVEIHAVILWFKPAWKLTEAFV